MTTDELIEKYHGSGRRTVIAVTGGGSRIVSDLLSVPGGSRSLLEAIIPYSQSALEDFLGHVPEQSCCERTARAMAMAAFQRARSLDSKSDLSQLTGIGVTASLASDRPKRGDHRIHIAVQTDRLTLTVSFTLVKGKRTRQAEEAATAELVLRTMALTLDLCQRNTATFPEEWHSTLPNCDNLSEFCFEEELPVVRFVLVSDSMRHLFFDSLDCQESTVRGIRACRDGLAEGSPESSGAALIFPGSFNPIHRGHRKMIQLAQERWQLPVELELSVRNVDKPPLDYLETADRLRTIRDILPDQVVWLTALPRFIDKTEFFPSACFIVGTDTITRIADLRYYDGAPSQLQTVLAEFRQRHTGFHVFFRRMGGKLCPLDSLGLPDELRGLCDEVPSELFWDEISSTELRQQSGQISFD